jgi:hypothetical protein
MYKNRYPTKLFERGIEYPGGSGCISKVRNKTNGVMPVFAERFSHRATCCFIDIG